MLNVEQFIQLQKNLEILKKRLAESQWKLKELMSGMAEEFNCQNFDQGKEFSAKVVEEIEKDEQDCEVALQEFETKWKEYLNEQDLSASG